MNLDKYKHLFLSLAAGGLLLIGLFLLLNGTPQIARAAPGDLFATPTGSGSACTQASPCDLQTALGAASDGDTIYLAEGVYTGAGGAVITVTQSITLYGGWDGATTTPPARDPAAYPTTINGEETRRGIYITGPATVTLEGLTIANGKIISATTLGWDGAGLYARDAVLTLRHTNFYSNVIDVFDVDGSYARGGGAAVDGGSLLVEAAVFRWNSAWAKTSSLGGGLSISHTLAATVTKTLFQDNDAWHASGLYFLGESGNPAPLNLSDNTFEANGWGHSPGSATGGYAGALKVSNAQARIEDNLFHGNRAVNDYGAVYAYRSELELTRNVIVGNENARTSGLYLTVVSPLTATNNIIAGNISRYYWVDSPAVRVWLSNGRLLHNTIAHNRNQNTSGSNVGVAYGLLVANSTLWMTNTILVSHTVGISVPAGSAATLDATLWGSGVWANGSDWDGDGTIITGTVSLWGDPAFVDPDGGNYHIGSASAAIDAGVNAGVTDDVDGDPRPSGAGYDIGADEYLARIHLPLVLKNYP